MNFLACTKIKISHKRRIEGEQHDIKEHFLVEESYQRERGRVGGEAGHMGTVGHVEKIQNCLLL